jgi:hypothetical protein
MTDSHDHRPPQDAALENSPIIASADIDESAKALAGSAICYWNGEEYSDGATICSAHRVHKCWNGKWAEIGSC